MDFRGATNHFADPNFDGEPVQIYEPGEDDPITAPEEVPPPLDETDDAVPAEPGSDEIIIDNPVVPDIAITEGAERRRKVYVDGVRAMISERVEYLDESGKLITESLRDFTKKALKRRFVKPRTVPDALEICRAQASYHRRVGAGGPQPVHIDQIDVMYMFSGAWVPDLHGTSHSADHTYHVGPNAMIITPHNEDLAKFNRDGSTGQIYISHLPGHSELYLIIPFKDWPGQ